MKIDRKELLKSLESVSPALGKTGNVLLLSSCFVFDAGKVATYDGETSCTANVPLTDMRFAVEAAPLLGLLRKIDDNEIDVTLSDVALIVKGTDRRAGIRGETEIRENPTDDPTDWFDIPDGFADALRMAVSCVDRSDFGQYAIDCVHVTPEYVEASDGKMLVRWPLPVGIEESFLMHRDAAAKLAAASPTCVGVTESWTHFANADGLVFRCRKREGRYPSLDDYVRPDGVRVSLPEGMLAVIDRAGVFNALDEYRKLNVSLKKGEVRVCSKGELGWYEERKKIDWEGKPLAFPISARILQAAIKGGNTITVGEKMIWVESDRYVFAGCLMLEREK